MKKLLLALLLIAPGVAQAQSVVTNTNSAAGDASAVVVTNSDATTSKAPAFVPVRANGSVISTRATATSRIVSAAASTNATSVKATPGDVMHISGYNANAAARYIKLYNKATAPTVGTDTPIFTGYLAPTAKFEINIPNGLYFSTGIAMALTTGSADNDTGALTAADILALNLLYN